VLRLDERKASCSATDIDTPDSSAAVTARRTAPSFTSASESVDSTAPMSVGSTASRSPKNVFTLPMNVALRPDSKESTTGLLVRLRASRKTNASRFSPSRSPSTAHTPRAYAARPSCRSPAALVSSSSLVPCGSVGVMSILTSR
jgi:hypothetical protein